MHVGILNVKKLICQCYHLRTNPVYPNSLASTSIMAYIMNQNMLIAWPSIARNNNSRDSIGITHQKSTANLYNAVLVSIHIFPLLITSISGACVHLLQTYPQKVWAYPSPRILPSLTVSSHLWKHCCV